jgi:membrane protein YqaA with SNARE-associated domain
MGHESLFDGHLLQRLYDRVLAWAAHPKAPIIMSGLSFAESSFFPIPPDVMLGPMCLVKPGKAWHFAALCTASSILGGLLGYAIGRWAFQWIGPWLMTSAYADIFVTTVDAFATWGFVYILLAGFTPIPYKVFTIGAGVVGMPVIPFLIGSAAGRGARFFLVAGLIRAMGDKGAQRLRVWVDAAGWIVLLIAGIAGASWFYFGGRN